MSDPVHESRILAGSLTLRPWTPADLGMVIEAYRDPAIRAAARSPVDDAAAAERWLRRQVEDRAAGRRFAFAVLDEEFGDEPAGNVVMMRAAPGAPSGEVGYWTAAPARGRSLAPRALEALGDWAFTAFADDGLVRLELLHQVANEASCRVAHKAGYALVEVVPPYPPWPGDGHRHERSREGAWTPA
ncbi:GNAT family N-acetyltransferase [Streptomyces sp. NPDC001478]